MNYFNFKSEKKYLAPEIKKQFIKWFWGILVGIIGLLILIFFLISVGWLGYVPRLEDLENPKNKFATEIYSSDNKIIGTFYAAKENRMNITYQELSPNLINALIATEDRRFYKHSGIDGKALLRALLMMGGGGSTLSQQTAKLLYTEQPASNIIERVWQKMNEWVTAVKLEKLYTKEEIITLYLNRFDWINNAVGIKTASQVYFNTTPDKLSIEQAALLVGMCQNPAAYNPNSRHDKTREKALYRRNVVLNQMRKAEYITKEQYEEVIKEPINLDFHSVDHKDGLAPYLREYLRVRLTAKKPKRSNYADWQLKDYGQYYRDSLAWETDPLYGFIEKNPKKDGSKYNLYTDGLKVYTTIDSRMQKYAEDIVIEHLTQLQNNFFKEKEKKKNGIFPYNYSQKEIDKLIETAIRQSERYRVMIKAGSSESEVMQAFNTPTEMDVFTWQGVKDTMMTPRDSIIFIKSYARIGFISMEPANGHVKAYIGGPNFRFFQYDMATQGRRQVGSTVKPFLYTLAMNEGMQPCDVTVKEHIQLLDALGRPLNVRGSSAKMGEVVTLRWGLQNSDNFVTAYLMSLFTPEQMVKLMRNFGISGYIPPVVSLCFGPCEISVNEMVSAYTTFTNKGIRTTPVFVTHISENNSNVIADFVTKTNEVINEETSYKMVNMMSAVLNGGTGSRARRYGFTAPAAGKTGTTQDNSDGWFIGYTPQLVSGCWVGWEDRQVHFSNMGEGQGAAMALPVWALFMKRVYDNRDLGYTPVQFSIPEWFNANSGCQ